MNVSDRPTYSQHTSNILYIHNILYIYTQYIIYTQYGKKNIWHQYVDIMLYHYVNILYITVIKIYNHVLFFAWAIMWNTCAVVWRGTSTDSKRILTEPHTWMTHSNLVPVSRDLRRMSLVTLVINNH